MEVEDLNYDFNFNMFIAKTTLSKLKTGQEKQVVLKWMDKLSAFSGTIDELKLRNDFLYFLLCNIQNGELQPPFSDYPPPGALPALAKLLPGGGEVAGQMEDAGAWADKDMGKEKSMLYRSSPDGGAFLAAQPRPRCGAFCYLAVVSRSDKKDT